MAEMDEGKGVSRRRFLRQIARLGGLAAAGGLTLAACGDNTSTPIPTLSTAPAATATNAPVTTVRATTVPATKPASTPAIKNDPNFVEVGPIADFATADTGPKLIDLPRAKKPAKVFVVKQGEVYTALSNICTHQGCEVDWIGQDKLFECPCHGSQYDLEGTNVGGPAPLPLASYAMKVQGGVLFISIKKNS